MDFFEYMYDLYMSLADKKIKEQTRFAEEDEHDKRVIEKIEEISKNK